MPVRKIPKNHLVVTGRHASARSDSMVEFESTLEKDYMLLLDADSAVATYEEQPVRIRLPDGYFYVPDVLVKFHPNADGNARRSELVEVKPQAYLDKYADEYACKFSTAEAYAEERGWIFCKRTEHDIRTPKLSNLKFLRGYRRHDPGDEQIRTVMTALRLHGKRWSSNGLADSLGQNSEGRAQWLPVLWHLVGREDILVDMDTQFGADVTIWLPD
jgi:hypothetical protein